MDPSALNHSSFFSSNHSLLHQLPQPDFLSQQLNPSAQTIITGAQLEQLESGSPSSTTTASRRPRKKMRGGADTGELLSDDDVLTSEEGGFDDADGDEAKPNATDLAKRSTRVKGKGKAKDEDEEESDFGGPGGAAGATTKKAKGKKSGDKKKKAGRACGVCQKAHLTCDDGRPCIRCIKKGCPEKCQDGARKKAKYLQEIPDELLERRPPTVAVTVEESPAPTAPTQVDDNNYLDPTNSLSSLLPSQNPPTSQPDPSPQPFNFDSMPYYDNTFSNEFGSEAANLEYAILSSMLNGNGFSLDTYGNSTSTGEQPGSRVMSPLGGNMGLHQPPGEFGGGLFGSTKAETETNGGQYGTDDLFSLGEASGVGAGSSTASTSGAVNGGAGGQAGVTAGQQHQHRPQVQHQQSGQGQSELFGAQDSGMTNGQAGAGGSGGQAGAEMDGRTYQPAGVLTAEEAYRNVTKPYPYAQSYHYLVKHLKERFEKNDILRIIRALATYRPSLIALQMPLSEEDETFVERTFQRTLVELNKLISFSGTPTVVWRRTGEICLVGTEFCLLTGWSREELLGKKYIFELFDTASVVEYYESFAQHAFESTSSSVMTQAVVLSPAGKPVPCAFCFSVRRDLFSCPSLVIGSFLPILV